MSLSRLSKLSIYKKYYGTVILKEILILAAKSKTYDKINKNHEEIIQNNLELVSNFPIEVKIKLCQ